MMRELLLDKIVELQAGPDGFNHRGTMRWSKRFLVPEQGIMYLYSKKEKGRVAPNAIPLYEATREDFETLSDEQLLDCYTTIIRQMSKQM